MRDAAPRKLINEFIFLANSFMLWTARNKRCLRTREQCKAAPKVKTKKILSTTRE